MIHVIGIGVNGRESLGARALGIISRAGLLAGGKRHLKEFPEFAGRTVEIKGRLDAAEQAIEKFLKSKGRGVAILATGDPLFFGIAGFIIKRFGREKVEVIPNVSSVQEAFARVKEGWAGAKVVSAHGRGADLSKLCVEAASSGRLAVFTDPVNTPARIAKALMEAGVTGGKAYVCEALGTEDERVTGGSLKNIAVRKRFHPLNIMLFVRDSVPPLAPRSFGIPDAEFVHSDGMITKEEIRVVTLS
ncbi:MAG: precorrin-6y C5,15-methyltransferase (decarboxylating) subunit CbiE, partial [Deltaproteobacteria bacterium]|nr:precorrin-6y C5,15-methyltransferase (decarboxylating) subunit CbiE [Deltaproteobacteria bacterium]